LTELNRLERELRMRQTDFSTFDRLLKKASDRRAKMTPVTGDAVDLPLNSAAASGAAPWPDYQQFLDATTRRRIERLYGPDFEAFGAHL